MSVEFRIGTATNVLTQGVALSEANNAETGLPYPLDIDEDMYRRAELLGVLRVYLAVAEGERLIGYAAFFISNHPHHRTMLHAQQDVIYVAPSHRRYGIRFLRWIDEQLARDGVDLVTHNVTVRRDFSAALARIGYEKVAEVFTKRL